MCYDFYNMFFKILKISWRNIDIIPAHCTRQVMTVKDGITPGGILQGFHSVFPHKLQNTNHKFQNFASLLLQHQLLISKFLFLLAEEITQVKEAIPWVRCASGNVYRRSSLMPIYIDKKSGALWGPTTSWWPFGR